MFLTNPVKKILNLLFISNLLCMVSFAEMVKPEVAQKIAINWYKYHSPKVNKEPIIKTIKEYKLKESVSFYIFSFNTGGFVIVSADDNTEPVIGYSFEGSSPEISGHEGLMNWFDRYASQIDEFKQLSTKSGKVNPKWQQVLNNQYSITVGQVVKPLITTKWGQEWPYNATFPTDSGGPGGHVWVGCVGVAMAQIMKYHNYPSTGIGKNSYQYSNYPITEAKFGATNYNWTGMPDSLITVDEDVSTLMLHCAISVNSMWGSKETTTEYWIEDNPESKAWVNNFGYAFGQIKTIMRNEYSNKWDSILINELINKRPIYYAGSSEDKKGHTMVCDGVDENGFYHFNFGWSGHYDGYYNINELNPNGDFTHNQWAIIGIQPNDGSTITDNTVWSGNKSIHSNIFIPKDITLSITSGSVIKFDHDCQLIVDGTLQTEGEENNYVILTALDTAKRWDGLKWEKNSGNDFISKLSFTQVEYSKNHGVSCVESANISFEHCKINNNYGGEINNDKIYNGGGVLIYKASGINIKDCLIFNNASVYGGGGIHIEKSSSISIVNSSVYENISAIAGGGISIFDSPVLLENNLIYKNSSNYGGVFIQENKCTLISNEICNNRILKKEEGSTGGIHVQRNNNSLFMNNLIANNDRSGLMIISSDSLKFLNNTIVNNLNSTQIQNSGMMLLKNNIFYNNGNEFEFTHDGNVPEYQLSLYCSQPVLQNCNIMNGFKGILNLSEECSYDTSNYLNNIDVDPGFSNPSGGKGIEYDGLNSDWSLKNESVCINVGDTAGISNYILPLDIAGNNRLTKNIDIGAYENINGTPLSIKTSYSDENILIYSNPCKDKFTIKSVNPVLKVYIYDTIGQLIYKMEKIDSGELTVDCSAFISGIYIAKVYINNSFTSKMFKIQ